MPYTIGASLMQTKLQRAPSSGSQLTVPRGSPGARVVPASAWPTRNFQFQVRDKTFY